jgi:hypothetical protein
MYEESLILIKQIIYIHMYVHKVLNRIITLNQVLSLGFQTFRATYKVAVLITDLGAALAWRRGLLVSSPPVTEEIGTRIPPGNRVMAFFVK